MKTAFIVAEYNPFHNGHKYHIEQTRAVGADYVVAVMSGNFVQRGAPAVARKQERAAAAVMNGADLAVELPVKYALSSAENFALGGVMTASACGLPGFLSFGASADRDTLARTAELKNSLTGEEIADYQLSHGCSYPVAVSSLLCERGVQEATLDDANNVLGLEYISALEKCGSKLDFNVVKRYGSMHASTVPYGDTASGTYIRQLMENGGDWGNFVPAESVTLPEKAGGFADSGKFSSILQAVLATKTAEDFSLTDGVSAGLENRIAEAVRECNSFSETAFYVKSKRYTFTRICRLLIASALGITKEDLGAGVSYIRVLAANGRGRELLREMKNSASLPVVSNLSEIPPNNKKALRDAELDYLAGKFFNLCLSSPSDGNTEYNIPPFFAD